MKPFLHAWLPLASVIFVLLALPPFLDVSAQNVLTKVLIAALFATSFNLLAGQAGLLSFGHSAFLGLGAITTMHVMMAVEHRMLLLPTPLLPLVGAVAGLASGALMGYFATKRSGVYFALVTVAASELLYSLAPHWEGIFGGEAGLSSMRMPWAGVSFGESIHVYYLTLGWTAVSMFALWLYTRTPFGRLTVALRENEQRVRFLGYDTHPTKVIVFSVSAAFSGIAGALLALTSESANYTLFSGQVSAQVVLHAFIGGVTLFLGPALGAAVLTLFGFFLSDLTRSWLIYQGLLFMIVMLYAPTGLAGIVQWHLLRRAELPWKRLLLGYALGALAALMIGAAVVFLVESIHIVGSESYKAARRASDMGFPPYVLAGISWLPTSVLTWFVPVIPGAVGAVLLSSARCRIARVLAGDQPAEEEAVLGASFERLEDLAPQPLGSVQLMDGKEA